MESLPEYGLITREWEKECQKKGNGAGSREIN